MKKIDWAVVLGTVIGFIIQLALWWIIAVAFAAFGISWRTVTALIVGCVLVCIVCFKLHHNIFPDDGLTIFKEDE